ncbi:ATP-binding protein [Bacterioplanoides sp. SCSIO 12839]|uniref:ATP-binding protein n=1 Tax=Bacterioplanoides sp. SCSIO 12839 TaxID=2829569 RepID=UPI0021041C18|nr:ATP-binding protein [Bacterioplanoides sp. SCSIO 12839]UTW48719.1 HAMP domain-containing histidine kinase [Bacterioplanoides sp. SCSIO 12839]
MNHDLNLVLQRLSWLRLSIASVWLIFLGYLQYQGFGQLSVAWLLLALYMPLLLISGWQGQRSQFGKHQPIKDWHLLLHLAFETQLLAGLLFFTGGATNPFISYFLVLLVFAAYSLNTGMALWVALLCIIDYSALTQWYQPLMAANHNHALGGHSLFDWHLAGMWLTFVISALIVITFIPMLLKARQKQQKEIQQLREQQLKNEQLIGIATLAAGTAHEMGTPLMTMHMILDDIAMQPDHLLTKQDLHLLREQVASCRQSLQHLANAGRHAHHIGQQTSYHWLCTLLHRWRLSHPNALWVDNGIDAEATVTASPLLDQALLNLLDNAAEAGNQPIELKVTLEKHLWTLDIVQPDPEAASHINKQALFSSNKEHGMGIGLYLSNASVEQFGGQVLLKALDNGGSLCQIQLPRVKPNRAKAQ